VAQELREVMASLGIRTIDEMIGRTDLLEIDENIAPAKAMAIDYSKILYRPDLPEEFARHYKAGRDTTLDSVLDRKLISMCEDALKGNKPVNIASEINNTNRAAGSMLSGQTIKRCGNGVLLEDTIVCRFKGTAGQSFGAFLAKGITFELEGMANDYIGKGISGGKIIVYPDRRADYDPGSNIIIGNTAFYGAISGEAYISGAAGERFCVRNSGIYAVVEGVGDHGCEYMTGGRVIILGGTGRNFGAGMSGGIAYVYDEDKTFKNRCNPDMILLEEVREADRDTIYNLLKNHIKYTKSKRAEKIVNNMQAEMKKFTKVMPIEYKRILEGIKVVERLDLAEALDG
jgi:glutamate synthase (ferredoxin)